MNAHVKPHVLAWIDVGAVGDIPRRGSRRLPSPIGDIAVFRTGDGNIYALKDACPHKGIPLYDGIVYDRTVTCTWHGWCFRLEDGRLLDGGHAVLGTYPVRVVGEQIEVAVD